MAKLNRVKSQILDVVVLMGDEIEETKKIPKGFAKVVHQLSGINQEIQREISIQAAKAENASVKSSGKLVLEWMPAPEESDEKTVN